jgi:acyl-CoA oxidase
VLPFLARTIVYNFGHNRAKDIFVNPKGHESEQVRIFCVVKCLMGWNLMQLAEICRERCGGGSYLTHSGIPTGIEGAHSGMTAEGDNRVLM